MKLLVALCAAVFGTSGIYAASMTVDAALDSSVSSAFPNRAYGPGFGYIVQGSGFTDLINFNLSGTPKSAQLVPGSAMLLIHSQATQNVGATGATTIKGSSLDLNTGVTYNTLSGHEVNLGEAVFTVKTDGYYVALTGPGIDTAVSDLLSGSIATIDLNYLGQPQSLYDGAGDPMFAEALSYTYVVPAVPEPSAYVIVLMAFGGLVIRQFRRRRA